MFEEPPASIAPGLELAAATIAASTLGILGMAGRN